VIPNGRPSTRLFRLNKIREDVNSLSATHEVDTPNIGLSRNKKKLAAKYPTNLHYASVIFEADIDEDVPELVLQGSRVAIEASNLLVPPSSATLDPAEPATSRFQSGAYAICLSDGGITWSASLLSNEWCMTAPQSSTRLTGLGSPPSYTSMGRPDPDPNQRQHGLQLLDTRVLRRISPQASHHCPLVSD